MMAGDKRLYLLYGLCVYGLIQAIVILSELAGVIENGKYINLEGCTTAREVVANIRTSFNTAWLLTYKGAIREEGFGVYDLLLPLSKDCYLTTNTSATVARLFGAPLPLSWTGEVPESIFL